MECLGERRAEILMPLVEMEWSDVFDELEGNNHARIFYSALGDLSKGVGVFQQEFRKHVAGCDVCGTAYSRHVLNSYDSSEFCSDLEE